jgi:SAM-dependent methyltransferase
MLSTQPAPRTELRFPVDLICPSCGRVLTPAERCACPAGTTLQLWNGIPRLLFNQNYWGECSHAKMNALLARMDKVHWKQALKEIVPDEPVRAHLTNPIGTDFVYSMPWNEIETVLDIGSGMGFMTAPLASLARQVVAVEAVPERALFQAKRASQDGFSNWHPLIASGTALPFPPESFDLITLNGVFEYIGLWGKGDPHRLQQEFLAQVFRLLRPNGYLYIGIETRYALEYWLGAADHTELAFTSLMPRWLADWYCRMRRVPFYGSETAANGYRTYTHSPRQYAALLQEAGFQSLEVHGCFDGYNRQLALYSLADYEARRTTRRLIDPPASRLGWLRRQVADARRLYNTLEKEVVVFGRKTAKPGRLTWDGLPVEGTVTQFSSDEKVFALSFVDSKPTTVFKGPKSARAPQRLEQEFTFLQRLQKECGPEAEHWALYWPRPLGRHVSHGRTLYQYNYVEGQTLSKLLLPFSYDAARVSRLFTQLATNYVDLCQKLSAKLTPSATAPNWDELLARIELVDCEETRLKGRIRAACRKLRDQRWPARVTHGDLTLSNTVVNP